MGRNYSGDVTPPWGQPLRGNDPTRLSPSEHLALQRAPRLKPRGADLPDVLGKAWNFPNTALGLATGAAGYVAGQVNRLRPGNQRDPRVRLGHNAVEFINNPASPLGGLTLGNVTIYGDDPYDRADKGWSYYHQTHGHPVQHHEEQHTYQGQQLGPFYLPSNLGGGALGLFRDGVWGGASNWNERGPSMNPPRPWSRKRR